MCIKICFGLVIKFMLFSSFKNERVWLKRFSGQPVRLMQRPRFKSTLRLFTVSLSPTVSVFFSLSHQIKAWITQSHYFIFKLHLSYPFFSLVLDKCASRKSRNHIFIHFTNAMFCPLIYCGLILANDFLEKDVCWLFCVCRGWRARGF